MKYAVAKGETEISELTARIFEIKGKGSAAVSKQAEVALFKSNPHLADLTKVKPGTLIVIPELVDLPKLRGPQVASAGSGAIDQVKFVLEDFAGVIEKLTKTEEDDIAAQLQALKELDLRKFAAESPEGKEMLGKLNDSLKNRSKENRTAATVQKDGVKQLIESLDNLPI